MESPLLRLPPELRTLIYDEVLKTRLDGQRYKFDLALLQTSQLIRREARLTFLLLHEFVAVETPWEQDTEYIRAHSMFPLVAEGRIARQWPQTRLTVTIDAPIMGVESVTKFIMLAKDMPKFSRSWFYQSIQMRQINSAMRMRIKLCDIDRDCALSIPKQTELLSSFHHIKELHSVEFEGVDDNLQQTTRAAMQAPMESPTDCLERAIELKDQGNVAVKQGRFREAIELYRQSFLAIHIIVEGRSRHVYGEQYFDVLLTKRLENEFLGRNVYFRIRVRLVANTMLALLRLGEFEEAEFWGRRSINIFRQVAGDLAEAPNERIPGATEWGKIYYRTGIAVEELHNPEAREFYRIASAWMPNDRAVSEAVSRTTLRL